MGPACGEAVGTEVNHAVSFSFTEHARSDMIKGRLQETMRLLRQRATGVKTVHEALPRMHGTGFGLDKG
jgi:hypothetical protein